MVFDKEQLHRDVAGPATFATIPIAFSLFALLVLGCVVGNRMLCVEGHSEDREAAPILNQVRVCVCVYMYAHRCVGLMCH